MRKHWIVEAQRGRSWRRQRMIETSIAGCEEDEALLFTAAESRRLGVPLRLTRVVAADCSRVPTLWIEAVDRSSGEAKISRKQTRRLIGMFTIWPEDRRWAQAELLVRALNLRARSVVYRLREVKPAERVTNLLDIRP